MDGIQNYNQFNGNKPPPNVDGSNNKRVLPLLAQSTLIRVVQSWCIFQWRTQMLRQIGRAAFSDGTIQTDSGWYFCSWCRRSIELVAHHWRGHNLSRRWCAGVEHDGQQFGPRDAYGLHVQPSFHDDGSGIPNEMRDATTISLLWTVLTGRSELQACDCCTVQSSARYRCLDEAVIITYTQIHSINGRTIDRRVPHQLADACTNCSARRAWMLAIH